MLKNKKRKTVEFKPVMGSGDKGFTFLAHGKKVTKTSRRIELLAELDSLNCLIGFCKVHLKGGGKSGDSKGIPAILDKIQDHLVDAGALTAGYKTGGKLGEDVKFLEKEILRLSTGKTVPKKFSKPGGNTVESLLQMARAASRKLELQMWKASSLKACAVYLNRLSDLLYLICLKSAKM